MENGEWRKLRDLTFGQKQFNLKQVQLKWSCFQFRLLLLVPETFERCSKRLGRVVWSRRWRRELCLRFASTIRLNLDKRTRLKKRETVDASFTSLRLTRNAPFFTKNLPKPVLVLLRYYSPQFNGALLEHSTEQHTPKMMITQSGLKLLQQVGASGAARFGRVEPAANSSRIMAEVEMEVSRE